MRYLQLLALGTWFVFSLSSNVLADEGRKPELKVYFIGNSLTRGLSPDRLAGLFEAGGGQLVYGTQLGAGANLDEHWTQKRRYSGKPMSMNYLENSGQFKSTGNAKEGTFRDYRFALQGSVEVGGDIKTGRYKFDAFVMQPYLNFLSPDQFQERERRKGYIGDRQAINRFIRYARGDNPSKHVATDQFYLYCAWPRLEGIAARGVDTDGDGIYSYAEFYQAPFEAFDDGPKKSVPSLDYVDQLHQGVSRDNAGLPHPIRLIPVGTVFLELDRQIRAGRLPGVAEYFERNKGYFRKARLDGKRTLAEANFPFDPGDDGFDPKQGVKNFFADRVHMNDQPHNGDDSGTIGAFVAAVTVHAVLTGHHPGQFTAEQVARSYESFDADADAELIAALEATVWQVITSDARTGLSR